MIAADITRMTDEAERILKQVSRHLTSEARRAGIDTGDSNGLPFLGGMWIDGAAKKCITAHWDAGRVTAHVKSEGQLRIYATATGPTAYDAFVALIATGKVPKALLLKKD